MTPLSLQKYAIQLNSNLQSLYLCDPVSTYQLMELCQLLPPAKQNDRILNHLLYTSYKGGLDLSQLIALLKPVLI